MKSDGQFTTHNPLSSLAPADPRHRRDRAARLPADWRQEWEAELGYRETLLAEWDKLDRRAKLALLWHSLGAFADAL